MSLEVELKFPLVDREGLLAHLNALGCRWDAPLEQVDLYFAHPSRDFKATDEALRLRQSGQECCITYKGPKLDLTTKTRREIELPISNQSAGSQYRELLEVLGFQAVGEVRKTRTPGIVSWQEDEIHIALDDVVGLGAFVELELIANTERVETAKNQIVSLANRLGLKDSERRGYLDLLMQRGAGRPSK